MNNWSIRGIVFSALFAAILMALSYLKFALPFSPVPITFSTLGIMLAGSLLGARYGFLSMFLILLLVAAGFPALAGSGGIAKILGPTGGYMIAWPFAALLIGWFAQRMRQGRFAFIQLALINFLFGSLLLYPTGVAWLAYKANIPTLEGALYAGLWPFLPGDLFKSLLCAAIVVAVWRVYPMERILGEESNTVSTR